MLSARVRRAPFFSGTLASDDDRYTMGRRRRGASLTSIDLCIRNIHSMTRSINVPSPRRIGPLRFSLAIAIAALAMPWLAFAYAYGAGQPAPAATGKLAGVFAGAILAA